MADTADIEISKSPLPRPRPAWARAFRDMSMHMKVTSITMVATVGTLMAACAALVLYDATSFRDHLSRDLRLLAEVVGDNSGSALVFHDAAAATDTLRGLRTHPSIITACIFAGRGELFAEYHRPAGERRACASRPPPIGHQIGKDSVTSISPIVLDGEEIGRVYIQSDLREQQKRLSTFGLAALGILAISAIIVLFVTTWFIDKFAVHPINALRDVALDLGKGNLRARAEITTHDEVGQLASVFNGMADMLHLTMDTLSEKNEALKREVEERLEAQAALEEARAHLVEAIEVLPEGFDVWDADDRFVMANSIFREMFAPVADLLVPGTEYVRFLAAAVDRGIHDTGGKQIAEYVAEQLEAHRKPRGPFEQKIGDSTWVRVSKNITKAGRIVGTCEDITEAKKARKTIQDMAFRDPLTGLANRRMFYTRLADALNAAERLGTFVALLLIDLDKFKEVNDTHGHGVGDALLVAVADRLREQFRKVDTVARLGGDEFAVIAANLQGASDINIIADRIVNRLSEPFAIGAQQLSTAASIGISLYPHDDVDLDELIKKADLALYQAKDGGRNAYCLYDPGMHRKSQRRKLLERQLAVAVERREFVIHYQPLIGVSDNRITGVEALIRWRHPDRGIVGPSEFIPVIEANGLIVPVGEWVLREACIQNKAWQDAGLPPFRLAVNISPHQFHDENLLTVVASTLAQANLAPEWLELEITENTFIEDIAAVSAKLERFRQLGVGLAIDDFGTGISSLSHLTRLPVNRLKIDRTFVRQLSADRDDRLIVNAVINLAHSLNLEVTAEGVETPDHLAQLRRLKCDEVQGFHFTRPLPAADFAEWVSARM